jgi:hypothetical protein
VHGAENILSLHYDLDRQLLFKFSQGILQSGKIFWGLEADLHDHGKKAAAHHSLAEIDDIALVGSNDIADFGDDPDPILSDHCKYKANHRITPSFFVSSPVELEHSGSSLNMVTSLALNNNFEAEPQCHYIKIKAQMHQNLHFGAISQRRQAV